jgi:hypothetical protein
MAKTVPPPENRPPGTEQPHPLPLPEDALPLPTAQFRRRAWIAFQRALDPLAQPRPMRLTRHN